jgi:hypothetical protein
VRTRTIIIALTAGLTLALATIGVAWALVPATSTSQHYYAVAHTDRGGFATVDLQVDVNPANVVVKTASGATNLGGEDPSFATVNFAGFVNTDDDLAAEAIRVRIIGWHANVVTGEATFRYYASKDARIAVDVYERTTVPPPPPA